MQVRPPKSAECSFKCCSKKVEDWKARKIRKIFEGNPLPQERLLVRAGKYSGCLLIERLMVHPTDCTRSSPGDRKVVMKEFPEQILKGRRKGRPEEVAVKSSPWWQVAEDVRSGREVRTNNVRPALKKTLSVLSGSSDLSSKTNGMQIPGGFDGNRRSQDGESTRESPPSQDGTAERTLDNSLPEGFRKEAERRAGNYHCNR